MHADGLLPRAAPALATLLSLAIVAATPAGGEPVPLPAHLEDRLLLEVRSCELRLGQALMAATLRARTGPTAVRLPDLRCGAFAPGGDQALFLNAVDGLDRIPPHTTRQVTAFFPSDSRHSECRCVVGEVRRIEREGADEPFVGQREARIDEAIAGWQEFLNEMEAASEPGAPLPEGALRLEEVVVPETPLRDQPGPSGRVLERLSAGQPVAVLVLEGGYKHVRTRAGSEGWIPSGVSSVDSTRAAQVGLALAPARVQAGEPAAPGPARPGQEGPGSEEPGPPLCSAVRSDDLGDLLFALLPESRTAYVHPLWYALESADQDAFQLWATTCFGITRIIDVARGLEVRNTHWGDAPASRP